MLKSGSIILACALAVLAPPSQAQTYPSRDITFIVPWNAGGSNDIAARALYESLGFEWVADEGTAATMLRDPRPI